MLPARHKLRLAILGLGFGLAALIAGAWIWTAVADPIELDFPTPFGDGGSRDHSFLRIDEGQLHLRRQQVSFITANAEPVILVDVGHDAASGPSTTGDRWVYELDATTNNRFKVIEIASPPPDPEGPPLPSGGGSIGIYTQVTPGGPLPWTITSRSVSMRMVLAGGTFECAISECEIPLWWFIALGLAIAAPALWLGRRSRQWRLSGHCPGCGYDLRESPDRCPECGRLALVAHPAA